MEVGNNWRIFFYSPTDGTSHLETCPNYSFELVCHFFDGNILAKTCQTYRSHLDAFGRVSTIGIDWQRLATLG